MCIKIKTYATAIGTALAAGGLSALITGDSMERYGRLNQPPAAPPGWIFPVVWTVLYVLMGTGAAIVYLTDGVSRRKQMLIYGLQLAVNFLWPILFFRLEARLFAFCWLILLLSLVCRMSVSFAGASRTAGLLQLPYILWLLFAGYLNIAVYLMNG